MSENLENTSLEQVKNVTLLEPINKPIEDKKEVKEEEIIVDANGIKRDKNGKILPGQKSLNPNGRPLGSKNFDTYFNETIKKVADFNKQDGDAIIHQLMTVAIKRASEGDYKYYNDIMNRLFGRAVQPMDLTSKGKELGREQIVTFKYYGKPDKSNEPKGNNSK